MFDYAQYRKSFVDETAVVDLGVGKNMVNSLRFWGKAFNVLSEDYKITDDGKLLFGKKGKDPYLEDLGTFWLLHYWLVTTGRASIYNIVFNEFRKERIEFTKEQLYAFLMRKCQEVDYKVNSNTLDSDITVFLRSYRRPEKEEGEVEDNFSGILMDLELMKRIRQRNTEGKLLDWYRIEGEERIDLPYLIVLYAIVRNYKGQKSITFRELLSGINSPGLVFALNAEGLYNKLQQIIQHYPKQVVYTETAGNQLLQFRLDFKATEILNEYYG